MAIVKAGEMEKAGPFADPANNCGQVNLRFGPSPECSKAEKAWTKKQESAGNGNGVV